MTQTRRTFLKSVGAGLAAAGLDVPGPQSQASSGSEGPARPPNLLLVMVDELPWDHLGFGGHPLVRTPHLDAFAAGGTRFENAYCVAPICRPSRFSVFSSRYAHVHGVADNRALQSDGELLLPGLLRHCGYDTALSGKLHFRPSGYDFGFDRFWSYLHEGPGREESYPAFLKRKHGKAVAFPFEKGSCPFPSDPLGRDIGKFPFPAEDFMSHWITDRAVDWLASRQGNEKPWFLFASYRVPHSPYRTPEPYFSLYPPGEIPVPKIPEEIRRKRPTASRVEQRHMVDSPELLRALLAQFYAQITNADHEIGRLLAELEERGLAEDTWVVFTSDHGNMPGDRGLWGKGVMYERATHVPLVLRAPKKDPLAAAVNTGRAAGQLIENIDLMPTLLELLGLPLPERGLQGRSFLPVLRDPAAPGKQRCFAERNTRMVRTPRHKLIETLTPGRFELFDLVEDPGETRDLAGEARHRELIAGLAAELRAWRAERPPPARAPGYKLPPYAVLPAGLRAAQSERSRDDD